MKEKLVSYDVAALAKEKGFDWETEEFYTDIKKPRLSKGVEYMSDSYVRWWKWNSMLDNYPTMAENVLCAAPTQSLLQKWLREVHNIFIYVEPTSLGDNAPFIKDSWGKVYHDPWKNNNKGIRYEYEEAMEFALLEALKLIKDE